MKKAQLPLAKRKRVYTFAPPFERRYLKGKKEQEEREKKYFKNLEYFFGRKKRMLTFAAPIERGWEMK